jgi:hypothetical protein
MFRTRRSAGRGSGDETYDELTIEAPDGPAGVVVGQARKRMRKDGTVPEEDEAGSEQETTTDPPADQLRAADPAAGVSVDPRVLEDIGTYTFGVATYGRAVAQVLEQLMQYAITLADSLQQRQILAHLADQQERALGQLARHTEGLTTTLANVAVRANHPEFSELVARAIRTQLSPASVRPSRRRSPASGQEAGGELVSPRGEPLTAPPPPPSASGAQLLPTPPLTRNAEPGAALPYYHRSAAERGAAVEARRRLLGEDAPPTPGELIDTLYDYAEALMDPGRADVQAEVLGQAHADILQERRREDA